MKDLVTQDNVGDVVKEIEEAFFDIPFENSAFQTERFVINAALTPERAYRAIGLRMHNRLRALREAQFNRMREDVDIEELQEKISRHGTSKYNLRRAEIDIQQKLSNRAFTEKLINDAIAELNVLYFHFKRLPKYTRQEFESAEGRYFFLSLERQIKGITGAAESMENLETTNKALDLNFAETKRALENGRQK